MTGWRKRQISDDDDIQEYVRPWVGLTDEQIQDCDPHEDCWHLFKIARAIEAKLKEKNT
jgi:hypothetical protein